MNLILGENNRIITKSIGTEARFMQTKRTGVDRLLINRVSINIFILKLDASKGILTDQKYFYNIFFYPLTFLLFTNIYINEARFLDNNYGRLLKIKFYVDIPHKGPALFVQSGPVAFLHYFKAP